MTEAEVQEQAHGEAGAAAEDPVAAGLADAPESHSPAAEPGAAEPIFTSLIFVDATPQVVEIAAAFRQHLWMAKRFGGVPKDEATETSQFFGEEEVPDEEEARAWARRAACEPLGAEGRTWRLTVLRTPAPARSAVVVRMARHVGDFEGEDLAEFESSLGVPLPPPARSPPAREERRKRDRSSSPQRKEPKEPKERKVRATGPGREPTAAELARAKIAELEAEVREPVPAGQALQAAIKACMGLREVNSNQKGGGGCALYHEHRILLYSTVKDLPEEHNTFVKERFEHMGRAFTAKTASTYRVVCDEIEGYLRSFT